MEGTLKPALQAVGLGDKLVIFDFTTARGRDELASMKKALGLPIQASGAIYTFIHRGQSDVLLLGHTPPNVLQEALTLPNLTQRLVLAQSEAHGPGDTYQLRDLSGRSGHFANTVPLSEALAKLISEDTYLVEETDEVAAVNNQALLPVVLLAGLVDGVNPCAFAVMLLLLAFLFTVRQRRERILTFGGSYVAAIYIVYLLIGLGLLKAVLLAGDTHLVAKLGAFLVMGLGLINLKDYFFPTLPIHLTVPAFAHTWTNQLLRKGGIPAAWLIGLLVGLCTFPCSGGIYVSIVTLLADKATLLSGITYLVLYNVAFVAPLIAILGLAGNRLTAKAWASWERAHSRAIHLWYGGAMIGLGLVILLWLV